MNNELHINFYLCDYYNCFNNKGGAIIWNKGVKRETNFKIHSNYLKKYSEYFILPKQLPGSRSGWLAYPITISDKAPFSRTEMQIFLEKKNIQTRVVFTGNIIRQPGFKKIKMKKNKNGYPEADNVMQNGILLGCHHGLSQEMISHMHSSIDNFISVNSNTSLGLENSGFCLRINEFNTDTSVASNNVSKNTIMRSMIIPNEHTNPSNNHHTVVQKGKKYNYMCLEQMGGYNFLSENKIDSLIAFPNTQDNDKVDSEISEITKFIIKRLARYHFLDKLILIN
mgnify:CR=1 FL=1